MYCPKCQKHVDDSSNFCMACGTPLKQTSYNKPQVDSTVKKITRIILKLFLGIIIWMVSVAILAALGTALQLPDLLYAGIVVVLPVVIAIWAVGFKTPFGSNMFKSDQTPKGFQVATPGTTPILGDRPLCQPKEVYAPKAPEAPAETPAQAAVVPPPAPITESPEDIQRAEKIKAEDDAIVQRMREATIAELQAEHDSSVQTPIAETSDEDTPPKDVPSPKSTSIKVASPSKIKFFTAKATGMEHYLNNIRKLACENPDYDLSKKEIIDSGLTDEKIWKYDFYCSKAELIPDPENPYDQNAIKVVVDGLQVGHIKAGSCVKILNKIKAGKIRGIDCEIGGGPYKIVYEDYDDDTYTMERGSIKHFVHLTIYESAAEE